MFGVWCLVASYQIETNRGAKVRSHGQPRSTAVQALLVANITTSPRIFFFDLPLSLGMRTPTPDNVRLSGVRYSKQVRALACPLVDPPGK